MHHLPQPYRYTGLEDQGQDFMEQLSELDNQVILDHLVIKKFNHRSQNHTGGLSWSCFLADEMGTRSSIDTTDMSKILFD